MTGMMAQDKTESWLTCTGQLTHLGADYSIIERENYNLSKAENSKQPKCPLKQEKAIMDALKAFQMI